jgi:excisionase family DNA binding protein
MTKPFIQSIFHVQRINFPYGATIQECARSGGTGDLALKIQKMLLRPEEVAEMIGVSRSRVYQMIRLGDLPSVLLPGGRLLRVPAAALAAKFERASKKTDSGVKAQNSECPTYQKAGHSQNQPGTATRNLALGLYRSHT